MKTNSTNRMQTAASFYEMPRLWWIEVNTRCVLCQSGSTINPAGEEGDDIFGA